MRSIGIVTLSAVRSRQREDDAASEAPQVLRPFNPDEAMSAGEAAWRARVSRRTIYRWCDEAHIGRRIRGCVKVSKVALQMLLDGDQEALEQYLKGDRTGEAVARYFRQCRIGRGRERSE